MMFTSAVETVMNWRKKKKALRVVKRGFKGKELSWYLNNKTALGIHA